MSRRLLLILGLTSSPVIAQSARVQVIVTLPPNPAVEGPSITAANVLSDPKTRELVQGGYATGLHFRVELWRKSGWFEDPAGVEEWDVLVSYDPAAKTYQVVRQRGKERENFGGLAGVDSAEALVDKPIKSTLLPHESGRYFYNAAVDIQPVSVSDLDAALGWLRGPVKEKQNLGTSLLKGIELVLSRVVGGGRRHFENPSGIFEIP